MGKSNAKCANMEYLLFNLLKEIAADFVKTAAPIYKPFKTLCYNSDNNPGAWSLFAMDLAYSFYVSNEMKTVAVSTKRLAFTSVLYHFESA